MKQIILTGIMLLWAGLCLAGSFNYLGPEELKTQLANPQSLVLLDIQVEPEFSAHHIDGAIATYAYPVKSDDDRAKLAAVLEKAKQGSEPVVIVCPRGAGGAERAYTYLKEQGIEEARLKILTGGQAAWPYPELLAK